MRSLIRQTTRTSTLCYKLCATTVILLLAAAIVMAIIPGDASHAEYALLKGLGWLSFFSFVGGVIASIWEL